jgi:hypothetical protein
MREVDLRNALFLIRALRRTQRLMDADHYVAEYDLAPPAEAVLATLSPPGTRRATLLASPRRA